MQRFLGGPAIQAKLSVSQPGDPWEREADEVAEQVMRMPAEVQARPSISGLNRGVYRKCQSCEEEEERQEMVLRKAEGSGSADTRRASIDLPSAGKALPSSERNFFEPRFGYDFSSVRIHTDLAALNSNRQLNARAFTVGNQIAFNAGQYEPHSVSGRMLLAHELTHVVQQSGGSPALSGRRASQSQGSPPQVQANGRLTEEETQMMLLYIRQLSGEAPPPGTPASGRSPAEWPPPDWPQFERMPRDWPALSDTCPQGACHQVNEGFRRAAMERERQQRDAEMRARWQRLHQTQHGEELDRQARTLGEEIDSSEMMSSQLRLQMFDQAIATNVHQNELFLPPSAVTTSMRDSWAAAQQATMFLNTMLKHEDLEIPEEAAASLRQAYLTLYSSIAAALRERDRSDWSMDQAAREAVVCNVNCHRSAQSQFPSFEDYQVPNLLQPLQPSGGPTGQQAIIQWLNSMPAASPQLDLEPAFVRGDREEHLNAASDRARTAGTPATWRTVISDFRWATQEVDRLLMARVPRNEQTEGLIEQFNYTRDLLERQRAFFAANRDAVKVRAIFYPKDKLVCQPTEGGTTESVAQGIPWQFYLTHTPVDDSGNIPADFEWQLHDITAPVRENRTVKLRYRVNSVENYTRSVGIARDPRPITQMDPPHSLYANLDDADFFPEGVLYWVNPHSGQADSLVTNAGWSFGQWLKAIGMATVLIGSLVFAPFSTPMLATTLVGTGLSIMGGVADLMRRQQHGTLRQEDVDRFFWDLSLDIVSALTLGMGRVASISARAGNLVRASSAGRYWFLLQRVELGMNVANVGLVAADFIKQYQAIERSNMSPEEKRAAQSQLTMMAVGMGLISMIPVYTGVRDLRQGRRQMHLDVDPANPNRLVANLEAAAEGLEHTRGRPSQRNRLVGRPLRGRGENRGHSYGLWSDGRITRCSDPPCPVIAATILGRIDDLRTRTITGSTHMGDVDDLARQARQLSLDAEQAAASAETLAASRPGLLQRASNLDQAMAQLEQRVMAESLQSVRGRIGDSAELDNMLARDLPDELSGELANMVARIARSGDFDPEFLQRMVTRVRHMDADEIRSQLSQRGRINRNPGSQLFHPPESMSYNRLSNYEDVSLLEAQMRGYGVYRGPLRRLPGATPAAGQVIAESAQQGRVHIESLIGDPISRQGLEGVLPRRGEVQDPTLRQSLDLMVAERLHMIGAGFGAETATGVAYGPHIVNQFFQNRGVEELIRRLHATRPQGVRYTVRLDAHTIEAAEGRFLGEITYRVVAVKEVSPGQYRRRDMFEGTISVPRELRPSTRRGVRGDVQGIGLEVEPGFGSLAEHYGY